MFKYLNPSAKISFSKFAQCTPQQCVLAGASGTHSVCVYTKHQNMELMFQHAKFNKLTEDQDIHFKTPQDCVVFLQCNLPNIECCLGKCDQCGDTEQLQLKPEEALTKTQLMNYHIKSGQQLTEPTWKMWYKMQRNLL